MALITVDPSGPSMDTSTGMLAAQITGLVAGAAINACTPCYIDSTTGKVFMSDGTAADQKARFAGICPKAATLNQAVTLFGVGARFRIAGAATLTPGAVLYLGATAGRFDTTATAGDAAGKFQAISDTDIRVTANI